MSKKRIPVSQPRGGTLYDPVIMEQSEVVTAISREKRAKQAEVDNLTRKLRAESNKLDRLIQERMQTTIWTALDDKQKKH